MQTPESTNVNAQQPAFAKEWMAQWRYAAQELPKIRARELRAMTDEQAIDLLGVIDGKSQEKQHVTSGLVIQQAWFQRMRQFQLQRRTFGS
jgi:hypothetical protein